MDWGQALHARIAAAIRAARGDRSAQWLAGETARLGHPISRSQIANYETGRKHSLDVAELMILAAALGISPSLLLFPGFPDGRVELLPGQEATAEAAQQWLSGGAPLPGSPVNEGTKLVDAVEFRALWNRMLTNNRQEAARYADRPDAVKILEREAEGYRDQVAAVNAEIRKAKASAQRRWGLARTS
jgi:transcriptional regulator with XRE-family HTH domain